MEANRLQGLNTIILPAGLYKLTMGELTIVSSLNILGAGSGDTIIDGNRCPTTDLECDPQETSDRVFHIVGSAVRLQINGVTIQNAGAVNEDGGAIAIGVGARLVLRDSIITRSKAGSSGINGQPGGGGGIANAGDLFIFDSTISNNAAANQGGGIANSGNLTISASTIDGNASGTGFGGGGGGGGIVNSGGTVRIEESTISNNHQRSSGEGGGGIFNDGGRLEIDNSTISSNTQESGTPQGGGIYNNLGEVFLFNATITNNRTFGFLTPSKGGGIFSESGGGFVLLANTIIAGNFNDSMEPTASDCGGTLDSGGFNLLGTKQNFGTNVVCDFRNAPDDQDQIGVSLQALRLGPLQRNGGLTQTHALLMGSRAINKGNPARPGGGFNCIPFDQRFLPRPFAGFCDIGAVEFGVTIVNDKVNLNNQDKTFDPTPQSGAPGGIVTITQTYANVGGSPLSNLVFEVKEISDGAILLNADAFRGRRGVGARKSAPPNQVVLPGALFPLEEFKIGLQTRDVVGLKFTVDVLGSPGE
jgi:hypothetical protein